MSAFRFNRLFMVYLLKVKGTSGGSGGDVNFQFDINTVSRPSSLVSTPLRN